MRTQSMRGRFRGWGRGRERKSIFLGEVGVSRKFLLWSCVAPKDMLVPKPLVLVT